MSNLINEFDKTFNGEASLRDSIIDIIENENVNVLPQRQVSDSAVFEVAERVLTASASLETESLYFAVLREVSNFISLAINGSRPNGEVAHTDLLPIGHPETTMEHGLNASAVRRARGVWMGADPRIEDDHVRVVVASAFAANPLSPEFLFAITRLRSVAADQVPTDILLSPLLAAFGDNPYAGRNSMNDRSARAKAQRRDRFGQFAYQGGGVRFYVNRPDGKVMSVVGRFAGNGTDVNNMDIEITGVEGIKNGVYSVPTRVSEFVQAVLPEHVVSNIVPMAPSIDTPSINLKDLKRKALPSLWAATKVSPKLRDISSKANADAHYISNDGYEVSLYNKLTPELKSRIEETVKKHSPEILGMAGTSELDPAKPIYEVVSSMSGDDKVVAYAQDWNGIQEALANEDAKYPEGYNQGPLNQKNAPIAQIPTAEVPTVDEMTSEEEFIEPDLRSMVPSNWKELETNTFYSPDESFSVSIGTGYAGDVIENVETDSGDVVPQDTPMFLDNVFTVTSHADDIVTPKVMGIAFDWKQVNNLLEDEDPNYAAKNLVPEYSAPEDDFRADNAGVDEMAGQIGDWQENPTMSEEEFDAAVDNVNVSPARLLKATFSPGSLPSDADPDPINTIKSTLFPESEGIDEAAVLEKTVSELLTPSPTYQNRSDALLNPSQEILKRLRAAYTAHKHTLPIQAAVERILTDPQNYTVAQTLALAAHINLIKDLEPKQANGYPAFKASPKQREVLNKILGLRDIPSEEKANLAEKLHFLTQTEADGLIKKYSDNEAYPMIRTSNPQVSYKDIAKEQGFEAEPTWITTNLNDDQFPPSKAQMVKAEVMIQNQSIPEAELKNFTNLYKKLTGAQFGDYIDRWSNIKDYPFKSKFQPTYLVSHMGTAGPSPRVLASLERKLSKPLISSDEKDRLLNKIPYMTAKEAGGVVGRLQSVEDDYDTSVLDESIKAGSDIEGLRIPDSYFIKPEDEGKVIMIADSEGVRHMFYSADFSGDTERPAEVTPEPEQGPTEMEIALKQAKAKARRTDARLMRKAVLRASGQMVALMFNKDITPEGRRLVQSAVADMHRLVNSLDLRRRKNLTPEQVDDYLTMIRDGVADSVNAHMYQNLKKPTDTLLAALKDVATPVDNIIGLYQAGKRNEFAVDEMSGEMNGDLPDNWTGANGFFSDDSGRYTVMLDTATGFALYDGKFNPLRPNKIAFVQNWKDTLDTIDYNENVRRLPHFTSALVNPASPDYDADAWRIDGLADYIVEDSMSEVDELSGDVPRMGWIDAPAFYGPAFDDMPKETDYESVMNYIDGKIGEYYVIDYETTGLSSLTDPKIKNDPVQMAIAKVVNGKVVDKTSFYMNPGSPLSDWSAGRGGSSGLKGPDGSVVTEDWLSTQMSKKDAMQKFLDFVPQGSVLAGHNASLFDMEVLNRTLKEAGLPDFKAGGFIDTLGLARYILPNAKRKINPNNLESIPAGHTLTDLVNFFGIDVQGMHNAENDVEATGLLLSHILSFGLEGKANGGDKFNMASAKNGFSFPKYKALAATYKKQAADWIAQNADELVRMGHTANADDFLQFLTYSYNATGASSSTPGSMEDSSGTTEDRFRLAPLPNEAPTAGQLASIQRRLDEEGVFTGDARDRLINVIPSLTRTTVGDYVQLADYTQIRKRMNAGEPIDDIRVPTFLIDEVKGYQPTKNLDGSPYTSTSTDEMAGEVPADKISLKDLRKVKVDWNLLPDGVSLTDEGKDIVRAVLGGYTTMVQALAGTGKTFNIEQSAQIALAVRALDPMAYIVFNNNIAEEARGRLPEGVEIRTSDSLSFAANVNAKMRQKFTAQNGSSKFRPINLTKNSIGLLNYLEGLVPRTSATDTAYLNSPLEKAVASMENREIGREKIVKAAGDAVNSWTISGADKLGKEHFGVSEVPYTPELQALSESLWNDIMSDLDEGRSQIQVEFNHMFKNYALSKPNWRMIDGYGKSVNGFNSNPPMIVFLDEAQDINEVFFKMLVDQNKIHNNGIQIVAVGDSNQSLYQFRGSMDSLSHFDRDITLPLTQSFRSGQAIADVANKFLEIKDPEGTVRLVGNPSIESSVVAPDTMEDYDAIIVNTNRGAIDAISYNDMKRPETVVGVVPAFREELDLFIKTARWLMGKQDPKFKPKKMLPDLAGFANWREVLEEYNLHGSPALSKYINIINRTKDRIESDNTWDALADLERMMGNLRIKVNGFEVPKNVGTSGKLGNAIKYEVVGRKLVLSHDSWRKSYQLAPHMGTANNKHILKANGFAVPTGTYNYEAPLDKDVKKQLQTLVSDLSGEKIDVNIITVHRGKGLEYGNVRIWTDFAGPGTDKELAEDVVKAMEEEAKRTGIAIDKTPTYLKIPALNLAYTAVTRAKNKLDLGSLSWIAEEGTPTPMATPEVKAAPVVSEAEKVAGDKVVSTLAPGIAYEIMGDTIVVRGDAEKVSPLLKAAGFKYQANGKVWVLKVSASGSPEEALGKRMTLISNLKKRISMS